MRKLKQLEKINGRLAMGGLIYLVFTKLVSSRADILDQLKSYLIYKMNWKYYPGIFLSIYASVKARINPNNVENIAISVDSILFLNYP